MNSSNSPWDAIVVTCKTRQHADSVKQELQLRQKIGFFPNDVILLCVEDPQEGLGSGGASLNALLVITELLSARNKLSIISADILKDSRILIIHLGRLYSHDPCGRAFVALPVVSKQEEMTHVITNFDAIYNLITNQFNAKSPPGVWICSSDMIYQMPLEAELDLDCPDIWEGVCCISFPADIDYARKHGVYRIDEMNTVCDIIYQGSEVEIGSCLIDESHVSLVSGIVYFSSEMAGKMLSLHSWSPVDACTYMGLDSGQEPIQISLYFDILLCMASDIDYEDFVHGKRSNSFGHGSSANKKGNMEMVRKILWKCLRGAPIKAVVLASGAHRYLDITDTPRTYVDLLGDPTLACQPCYYSTNRCFSISKKDSNISDKCLIINSIIGENVKVEDGTFIAHSHLEGSFVVGRNSVIIGIDKASSKDISRNIPENSFVIGCNITVAGAGKKKVFCTLWNVDKTSFSDNSSSILGDGKDQQILSATGRKKLLHLASQNVHLALSRCYQNTVLKDTKTMITLKLYPVLHARHVVGLNDCLQLLDEEISDGDLQKWRESWRMSLHDILENTDYESEFQYRRNLSIMVCCEKLKCFLTSNRVVDLKPLYVVAVASKKHDMILSALDEAALQCISDGKPHLCARVFSCIAEVLAMTAGSEAGLRSGPAANREWKDSLLLLNNQRFSDGVVALSKVRQKWMSNADSLIRSGRHYERASQIFIRFASASVSTYIRTLKTAVLEQDTWLVCESPARIDLSGGWSDTPPVCYENGGAVLNMAIRIDGKKPIGTRVRRISDPVIKFSALDSMSSISHPSIIWDRVDQFHDYCRPQAQGALVKACFVLTEIVSLNSSKSLKNQLLALLGCGGLEIQTWSNLPRGSGMGTSSILAGTIIMALFHAVGKAVDTHSVIHAVVMVEQMLTTGGGWQDQVGGLIGGVKICSSEAKLPLEIKVESIDVSDEFLDFVDEHMKMIYTGKTRLARNVLQEVLRNWYAKKSEIISNCDALVENAFQCRDAFVNGDSLALGRCITAYRKQKKIMARGSEPQYCVKIMEKLESRVLGQLLAGAGGGGFCFALFKDPIGHDELTKLLEQIEGISDVGVFNATIDRVGVTLYKELASS